MDLRYPKRVFVDRFYAFTFWLDDRFGGETGVMSTNGEAGVWQADVSTQSSTSVILLLIYFSFAHYMIGNILDEHTRQDIVDAKALGLDAFALNIGTSTFIKKINNFRG